MSDPAASCPTCGAELPAGGACTRCLLHLALTDASPAIPEELGSYTIVSLLGAGGMGEVYRARDPRLDREVAIKVLPEVLVGDPERTARFRREARVAASLNHSNIAAVYGFEEDDGVHFLVMELVEGVTLAERLERLKPDAMPIEEALACAAQVAEGLDAAHERGIVHRDLKPGNIRITPAGQVKILDFGLAKALDPPGAEGPEGLGEAAITGHYTGPGAVLGTVPYMSPEQARGQAVDKRTDIWSLGCVLFECLSGRRAFDGDTTTDVVAKILEREPAWEALPPRTPPRVRELLGRCLEKDLKRRMRDSGDVRLELERALASREWTGLKPRSRSLPWALAGLALGAAVLLGTVAWQSWRRATPEETGSSSLPSHVVLTDPDVPRIPWQDAPTLAVSPDGLTLVYTGKGPGDTGEGVGLYARRIDDVHARRLELPCAQPVDPFFSPDGKSLGFSCGSLYRVSLAGGRAAPLLEGVSPLKGATWSSRGIVFSPGAQAGLVLVAEGGGPLETLTVPDASKGEVSHRWPSALPDGRHVLFTIKKEGITTFDQGEIALLDLDTKRYVTLLQGGTFARLVQGGQGDQILFVRGSTLLGVPLDVGGGRVRGAPVPLLEGVMTEPSSGAAQYAATPDGGTLVFVPGGANVTRTELCWIDRQGKVTPIGAPLQHYDTTRVSPDGTRLASTVFGATDGVVVYDLARGTLSRLTSAGNCAFLAWSRDGRQVLYRTDAEGPALVLQEADGTGTPHRLTVDPDGLQTAPLLADLEDGRGLVYAADGALWVSPLSGGSARRRLGGDVPLGSATLALSPDGRWLAHSSDLAGRGEIYVKPFPMGNESWQVSRGGGAYPSWSNGGRELFYFRQVGDARWVNSARIVPAQGRITVAPPTDLFPEPAGSVIWDVHPDGERFILVRPVPPQFKGDRIEAILGWSNGDRHE